MPETKHTPGPWVAVKDEMAPAGMTCWDVLTHEDQHKKSDDPNRYLICDLGPERPDGTTPHNARLIAAAPDLLAACKVLVAGLDRFDGPTLDEVHQAEAAIRKATGQPA